MTVAKFPGKNEEVKGAGGFAKQQVTLEQGLSYDLAIFQERITELHGLYQKELVPETKNQIAAEINYFNDKIKELTFMLQTSSVTKKILEILSIGNKPKEEVKETIDLSKHKVFTINVEVEVPIALERFEDCGDDEAKVGLRSKNILKSAELLSLIKKAVSVKLKD